MCFVARCKDRKHQTLNRIPAELVQLNHVKLHETERKSESGRYRIWIKTTTRSLLMCSSDPSGDGTKWQSFKSHRIWLNITLLGCCDGTAPDDYKVTSIIIIIVVVKRWRKMWTMGRRKWECGVVALWGWKWKSFFNSLTLIITPCCHKSLTTKSSETSWNDSC